GLQTAYRQVVVQLKEDFLGDAFRHTPEFREIEAMFARAAFGLAFGERCRMEVGEEPKQLQWMDHFEQLIALLRIFRRLAREPEASQLNEIDTSVKTFLNDKIRMSSVYEYIHRRYDQAPDVNEIAAQVHLSTAAFFRYFKRQTRMTFTDFVNQYRIGLAKTLLLQDRSVSDACFSVGIESLSYFNKLFRLHTGENPSAFRKKHLAR